MLLLLSSLTANKSNKQTLKKACYSHYAVFSKACGFYGKQEKWD